MQGEKYKIVHIQNLEYRQPQSTGPKEFLVRNIWNKGKTLLTYQQNCKATHRATFFNGFFSAFLEAYNNHGDVKISPDDVWITIMLYFSKYVNDHSEQLRHAFVSHEGRMRLEVTSLKQTSESKWDQFFTLMLKQMKKKTSEGVLQKIEADFSTTGRFEKLMSIATIMNTCQKFFQFVRIIPLCGIQNVHFGGTLQDWQKLRHKLEHLREYDVNGKMKDYVSKVGAILDKFIETYKQKVDVDFWNRILNLKHGSGGSGSSTYYSGWLNHFFGLDGEVQQVKLETLGFDIQIDNQITNVKKTVRFVGGIVAVSQERQVYRPHISFAIQDADPVTKQKQKEQ